MVPAGEMPRSETEPKKTVARLWNVFEMTGWRSNKGGGVNTSRVLALTATLAVFAIPGAAQADFTSCQLEFETHAWSFFYKNVTGTGTVTCENGDRADVTIRYHGGGVTFGVADLKGIARFSQVRGVNEVMGAYGTVEGHAGFSGSVTGRAGTRGPVWTSQSGQGRGWNLGFAFGAISIRKN
jgi:hypothetical protein